jgi:DNA-directed RNA polymerase subunit RPC12/RpoP
MIIYQCDVCGKQFDQSKIDDLMEAQEMFKIRHSCGYNSVFGDLNHLDLDICQYCFKKMLDKAKVNVNRFLHNIEEDYKVDQEPLVPFN